MSEGLLVILAIAVVAVAAIGGIVVAARLLWRRQVRAYIVRLIGYREQVRIAHETVRKVLEHLSRAHDETLLAFAFDENDEERHMISDVGQRMAILADELAVLPLPRHLCKAADDIGDAAGLLAEQAETIAAEPGEGTLDALASADLIGVVSLLQAANDELGSAAETYGMQDASVYGGGLYI